MFALVFTCRGAALPAPANPNAPAPKAKPKKPRRDGVPNVSVISIPPLYIETMECVHVGCVDIGQEYGCGECALIRFLDANQLQFRMSAALSGK
jgi:hypothetical protein